MRATSTLIATLALATAPATPGRAQALGPADLVVPGLAPLLFGGMSVEESAKPLPKARAPMTAEAARTWLRLQQKVEMPFANETPLEDVLRHIKDATRTKDEGDSGLSIFVDPVGLQAAEKSESTPVRINLEGLPLASSLQLALDQLDLTYYVRPDGLLLITSADSAVKGELLMRSVAPVSLKAAKVWVKLFEPVSMPFANETPLEDVLKYIKQATITPDHPDGVPIYVDPLGLQEAEKTETTPIKLNLEGIPLAHTLKLLLRSIGLGYFVDEEGLLHVTDEASARAATAREPTAEEMGALESQVDLLKQQVQQFKKKEAESKPSGGGLQ